MRKSNTERIHVGESAAPRARLTRRSFLGRAASLAGTTTVLAALPELSPFASGPARARAPIVGFHMDHPYFDPSGTAEPYYPPSGTRSGQALADVAQIHLIGQFGYC